MKRALMLVACGILILMVTACGPNRARIECEGKGGEWRTESKYQYGLTASGKYEPVFVQFSYCAAG